MDISGRTADGKIFIEYQGMSDKLRYVVWLLDISNQLRAEMVSVLVSTQFAAVQCEHTLCLLFPAHPPCSEKSSAFQML